ncbi:MAG: DNA-binding response regulator [Bacteroidetes bacterium]|nr:MAG: DNA-binding response regulator [Bacteroidota bacterium]
MHTKIKAIIVEDEPLARSGLESYVRDVDFLELCALCENAMEANNALNKYEPELMFLDIQMPRLTGIDFLKSLKNPPMVIFTTAYPNYALQGFELDVVDYLVKPYPFDRFLKAVNKARDLHVLKNRENAAEEEASGYIFVKTSSKLERVVLEEINFVEAMENYVVIHTNQQKLITMMTMKSIEEILPLKKFIRIHKSYIANKDKISSIEGNEIKIGANKLPIARNRKQEVMDQIIPRNLP